MVNKLVILQIGSIVALLAGEMYVLLHYMNLLGASVFTGLSGLIAILIISLGGGLATDDSSNYGAKQSKGARQSQED